MNYIYCLMNITSSMAFAISFRPNLAGSLTCFRLFLLVLLSFWTLTKEQKLYDKLLEKEDNKYLKFNLLILSLYNYLWILRTPIFYQQRPLISFHPLWTFCKSDIVMSMRCIVFSFQSILPIFPQLSKFFHTILFVSVRQICVFLQTNI